MPATTEDSVWSAADTTPGEVEAALHRLVVERHHEHAGYVPARALNLVCVVDKTWAGEVTNRLERVGRYHASRTILLAVEARRTTLDAVATVAADDRPENGRLALLRESIVLTIGETHIDALDSLVAPLVVPDISTVVWSPHGYPEAVDALQGIAQSVLYDGIDGPDPGESLARAAELSERVYVVDLAWLRSTPWRERVAAYFDPAPARPLLRSISGVTVRYGPHSEVAGLLLVGWLSSRLGWRPSRLVRRGDLLQGRASSRRQDVAVRLEAVAQDVPGLAAVTIETADGASITLERAPGGLKATRRARDGQERVWPIVGASRGEGGILGEGIRQALLRNPTYAPALRCARELVG